MKIFNLTDRLAPGSTELYPQTLRRLGIVIPPGESVEVPDDFRVGLISGWMSRGLISLHHRPEWYIRQMNEEKRAKIDARNKDMLEAGHGKKRSKRSRKSKRDSK